MSCTGAATKQCYLSTFPFAGRSLVALAWNSQINLFSLTELPISLFGFGFGLNSSLFFRYFWNWLSSRCGTCQQNSRKWKSHDKNVLIETELMLSAFGNSQNSTRPLNGKKRVATWFFRSIQMLQYNWTLGKSKPVYLRYYPVSAHYRNP